MPNQFFHDARPPRKGASQMEQAKLDPLRDAAKRGLEDLAADRYIDVSDDEIERYIAQLGARVAKRSVRPLAFKCDRLSAKRRVLQATPRI